MGDSIRRLRGVLLVVGFVLLAAGAWASEVEELVRRDVERFLRAGAAADAADDDLTIELPPLRSFAIDRNRVAGALRTEITTRARTPFRGRTSLTVSLYADERLVHRAVVTPYLKQVTQVLVPVRNLRVGSVVSDSDVQVVDWDAARLPRGAVQRRDEVLGLRVKRALQEGRPFRSDQVEGIPLVKRGDRVQLVLEAGPLRVSAIGKAQESGALGEWIRVMNPESRRELTGRVDAQGQVHVAF